MRRDPSALLGAGGMGEVFKAWDPVLERHIALKYLRRDDPELVERLFREARAQARVNHPGICEVYEVGEDDGRPFIAMQYVDGKLLPDAAIDLSLEQKVLILRQVADAVQAAHEQGLIHRDLKPSNIMVEETADGRLQPFVLDFGIAREQEVPGVTVTGQVMGTPGYLSPEQARGETDILDRRSDVFSLGVILYELVSGVLPHRGNSDLEILISLLEEEAISLRRVVQNVPRDLEMIVMTCLEHDPERRYASARALSEDLGRFLRGEPVHARQSSLPRRILRKARRHKVFTAVVLTSLVVVSSLVAVLVGGWVKYTTELKRERNAALESQRTAERNEQEAREVTELLVGVFEVSDPNQARGEDLTAREILDEGADRVATELADRPEVQARLLGVIGSIYMKLGMLEQARPLLERGVEVVAAADDPDIVHVVDAHVRLADLYIRSGEYDAAANELAPLAATAEEALGPSHLEVALALDSLGRVFIRQGKYAEAESKLRRALEIATMVDGPDGLETAGIENDLAVTLQRRGDLAEADKYFRRALATRQRLLDENDPRVATVLNNYGDFCRTLGRFDEAVPLLERALEIREKALGADHPRIASTCNNLALVYKKLARYEQAEAYYLRALGVREATYGPDHTRVATVLVNLASLYKSMGQLGKAESCYRRAAEIYRRNRPDHPTYATILNGLADVLRIQGRTGEAAELVELALDIRERTLGPEHTATATSLVTMALVMAAENRADEALPVLQRALDIQSQHLRPEHASVAATLFEIAAIHHEAGRFEEARPLFERALRIEAESGRSKPLLHIRYADLLRASNRGREADEITARAAEIQAGAG